MRSVNRRALSVKGLFGSVKLLRGYWMMNIEQGISKLEVLCVDTGNFKFQYSLFNIHYSIPPQYAAKMSVKNARHEIRKKQVSIGKLDFPTTFARFLKLRR
jgi:hypothetical protein